MAETRRTTSTATLRTLLLPCILGAIALGILPSHASADGGLVRARAESATLAVTVFTSPTPVRVGSADVSVLVQDRATGSTLLDADVAARLQPVDDDAEAVDPVRLGHEAATNKLLQAGSVHAPAAGRYRLLVTVQRAGEQLVATAEIEVAPPLPPLLALWPYLALPPVVVGIFLVHQWLRRRSAGAARSIARAGGGVR